MTPTLGSPAPRIVLAGDQNAGKTALVERLCGLSMDLPTYSTIEWHISPGPTFAQVYIAWNSPLDESTPRVPFGHPVRDISALENILRRAQIAIFLHNDEGSQVFNYSDSTIFALHASLTNFKSYTSRVIHVVYHHPDIPWEATIVDLPGVLTNGPSDLITISREITLANIKVATNIIVVVMPLTSAKRWSATWNLVQQEDPDLIRTIGLITKPSGGPNAAEIWHSLLQGDSAANPRSFCVYHPREGRQHLSLSYSRVRERNFFLTSAPWSMASDRHALGIDTFLLEVQRVSKIMHTPQAPIESQISTRRMVKHPQRPTVRSLAEVDKAPDTFGPVRNGPHESMDKRHHPLILFLVSLIILAHVYTLLRILTDLIFP